MQPSETASEPTEPVLVNPLADHTQRWCRVGRKPRNPEAVRAIYAAHRARLRRVRLRGLQRRLGLRRLLLWFKALLRR